MAWMSPSGQGRPRSQCGRACSGRAQPVPRSIATDSSNKVRIHYYDATNEELKYATNASGSWAIETVDSGLGIDRGGNRVTGIVLDSSDKAHIAYLPTGQVLGVSKLARLVDCFAHRLQTQERLAGQIADFLMENLKPMGVAVVLQASHICMTIRGIRKPGSTMVTSALRGLFKKDARSRNEVLSLMHHGTT